jgi:KDO2-lipid IV(A) lauroyltransferase
MRAATQTRFTIALLSPRYWFTWLGLGVVWLAARLPHRALFALGRGIGVLIERIAGRRRRIAERNLEVCFPELDAAARTTLLRAALRDLGVLFAEYALAWFGSDRTVTALPCTIEGLEYLEACKKSGKGALLVGAHFSHIDLCGRLLARRIRIAGTYRVMNNVVLDRAVLRARLGIVDAMFTRQDIRATIRYLKRGGTIWYAPDQDMHGKDSVFVPFFGIPASTITATHHLARLSGAVVIPTFHKRDEGGGYRLRLEAPLSGFPSGDVVADTARLNACIERMVREAPAQYLWVHRRFKTRPEGAPAIY